MKTVAAFAVLPMMAVAACGDDDTAVSPPVGPVTTGVGAGSSTGGGGPGVCLLNNCNADQECAGCSDGRTTCLVEENRCVACDPNTGEGCADGEQCSSFGICVPAGLTCPTDANGVPTFTCTQNSDCLACSPLNQVCDTVTGQCQACTETNTQHCLQSDICADLDGDTRPESCSPKCPSECNVDNDCQFCGGPGNEAHACNQRQCAECSDTFPCPAGEECVQGTCQPPCGIPGQETGSCITDEDCSFCGDPDAMVDWTCKTAANDDRGFCVPPANGCSDLGSNVVVLPPPYDQYTQTCSNDNDCTQAMAGIQFNVGKAIRDLAGTNEINLGFTTIPIADADVFYPMSRCADIDITGDVSCGLCVPCTEDADCAPIEVQPLLADLFDNDPLATLAGAVLIDLLWGNEPNPALNFFCQPIAFGYGACIPCANPLQACGATNDPGTGMCDHDECTVGGPLNGTCSPCAADVCANDPFCCNTDWDQLCVDAADSVCNGICSNPGGCGDTCTPQTGPLQASCDACTTAICGADPYCCNTAWDQVCVDAAEADDTNCTCP